jgi:hypothetical protein
MEIASEVHCALKTDAMEERKITSYLPELSPITYLSSRQPVAIPTKIFRLLQEQNFVNAAMNILVT